MALVHKRREKARADLAWSPASVTAIVPAFNEREVICKTLDALLASRVRNLKVIVVDDGSTDGTAELVRKVYGEEPRLKLICKPNSGKWSALNTGLEATDDEIVVMLDADTLFAPDAIELLVRHFGDPRVGAVCGHAVRREPDQPDDAGSRRWSMPPTRISIAALSKSSMGSPWCPALSAPGGAGPFWRSAAMLPTRWLRTRMPRFA